MSRVKRRWEKDGVLGFDAAGGLDGWGKDCLDPIVAEISRLSHVVSNKDEFY